MVSVMSARHLGKGLAVAVLGLGLTAVPAAARGGFHGGFRGGFGGAVIVRPYGFYGGFYDPWYWGPYWYGGPYWGYGYSQPADMGKVKIETQVKDAQVFIDGAYAGTAGQLKDIPLKAGTHDIEVRAADQPKFAERIYVLSGKTLKISPGF